MALDATIAGATANSYKDRTAADAYFASHWSAVKVSAWAGLTDAQKDAVLQSATTMLETLRVLDLDHVAIPQTLPLELRDPYTPMMITRYAETQSLQFPRNIDVDEDDEPFIPDGVAEALYHQAVYLLSVDESVLAAQLMGVRQEYVKAGGVATSTEYRGKGLLLSPMAVAFMEPYLRRTGRVVRG